MPDRVMQAYRSSMRLLLAAMVVAMTAMFALSRFAEANGDDFCRGRLLPLISSVTGWHRASDVPSYVVDSWHHWTGRWAAMGLETLVLTSFPFTDRYWPLIVTVWAVMFACLLVAVREVTSQKGIDRHTVTATAVLWILFWISMPGPGDGFYWFTGLVENPLPVALATGTIAALVHAGRSAGARRAAWFIAAGCGTVIVPGLHELYGLALLLVLLMVGLLNTTLTRRDRARWLSLAGLALVATAVVFVAPGNQVRASFFPSPRVLTAILISGRQALQFVPDWIFSVPLLSGSLLLTFHPDISRIQPAWVAVFRSGWRQAIIPGLTLFLVAICFAGPAYAMSIPAPTRTLNGAYLIFLVGWFLSLFVLTRRDTALVVGHRWQHTLLAISALFFAGSVTLQGNTRTAITDLATRASDWQHSRHERYQLLRTAVDLGAPAMVPRSPAAPRLFFALDIVESPTAWRNECVAGYFGIPSVVVTAADSVQKAH